MPKRRIDPARTLALLWRQPDPPGKPAHGPKPTLSVDRIVDTAIGLADADGLAAVTMRRVADLLGVVPMSLYTYVPGKAELLDLMADATYARMPRPHHAERSWCDRLTAIADANRALYDQHPWLTELPATRPPLGPGLMAKYEHELSAFDDLGLADAERDDCLTYLLGFVQQTARAKTAAQQATRDSGLSDEQWWAANQPLLETVFDPEHYPTAARVGSAAGSEQGGAYDPDRAYDFGLARVLDGLAAFIHRRKKLNRLPTHTQGRHTD